VCVQGEAFAATSKGHQLMNRMDINRSGDVSRGEFSRYMKRHHGMSQEPAPEIWTVR
jgi:hypothetical protein